MKKNDLPLKLMFKSTLFSNSTAESQISISNQSTDNIILFGHSRF